MWSTWASTVDQLDRFYFMTPLLDAFTTVQVQPVATCPPPPSPHLSLMDPHTNNDNHRHGDSSRGHHLPPVYMVDRIPLGKRRSMPAYGFAQQRFKLAVFEFPLQAHEWLFLCDDDAFVSTVNVRDFISQLDPSVPAMYGQMTCEKLCGGAGELSCTSFQSAFRGI